MDSAHIPSSCQGIRPVPGDQIEDRNGQDSVLHHQPGQAEPELCAIKNRECSSPKAEESRGNVNEVCYVLVNN